VFKLRQGVKWHNGDPFTSADVKFSLERTYDPAAKTRVNTVLTTIERIEAPDPTTVVVHTKKPDPLLPARLGFYAGQIVPKKYLESVGPETFNQKPVGTGPVRFVSWTKDDRVVLDANADYWGGKPDFDRLVVRALPEMAPRVSALLKGEVDIATQLPPDQGERVKGNASTVVAGALYGGLYVLAVNSKVKPLDNPLVKQALSLAIDRETIIKELWRGRGVVPSGPIAKGDNHFDASQPNLAYDPKEARERLKKAGYKGEEIIITTTAGYMAGDKPMAEAIQAMWKDVGINGKVEVVEYSVRAQMNKDKSFKGLWWSDPTSTLRDPDGMMWRLLGPGGPQDYWRHAEWDELGNTARFSVDEKFRGEAYKKMTKIFLEHLPWLPILQPYEDYGLQKYVEWTPDPLQQLEIRRFNFKFRRA
jgi:peptide/nickel transport system substrate-binding protein